MCGQLRKHQSSLAGTGSLSTQLPTCRMHADSDNRHTRGETAPQALATYHPQGHLVMIAQAHGLISLLDTATFRTLDVFKVGLTASCDN